MLLVRSLMRSSARVERRRLARAGRAGDEQDAVRPVNELVDQRLVRVAHAELVERRAGPACLSSRRSTTRSPCPDGIVETRTSTARPAMRSEMRPSCGRRFSAMSSFAMTLMRDTTIGATARFDCSTSRSTPSMRKRTDEPVLERLDVDVRRVVLDGLRQQRVDQADDRRVVVAVDEGRTARAVAGRRAIRSVSSSRPSTIVIAAPLS